MVELINGKIFKKAAAAPKRLHQKVSSKLNFKLYQFLEGKRCQVYAAPFDVRFPKDSKEDRQIFNVVQPDLCVICNPEKLDERGCLGAPDLIVEILSPGNTNTVALLMTHNFNYELVLLEKLSQLLLPYIGILGPKRKTEKLLERLQAKGISIPTGNLYAPIGLDLGAETSEEIALAILAEIAAVVRKRKPGFLRDKPGPIHDSAL